MWHYVYYVPRIEVLQDFSSASFNDSVNVNKIHE